MQWMVQRTIHSPAGVCVQKTEQPLDNNQRRVTLGSDVLSSTITSAREKPTLGLRLVEATAFLTREQNFMATCTCRPSVSLQRADEKH